LWVPLIPETRGAAPLRDGLQRRARRTLRVAQGVWPWVRCLRKLRPDVVVSSTATNPVPAFASAIVRVPHVWWLHEFVTRDHGFSSLLAEPGSQRLSGWFSEVVVANSRVVAEHFSPPVASQKVRIIYYGFHDCDVGMNRIDGPLRLLQLGHQTPSKGPELAI